MSWVFWWDWSLATAILVKCRRWSAHPIRNQKLITRRHCHSLLTMLSWSMTLRASHCSVCLLFHFAFLSKNLKKVNRWIYIALHISKVLRWPVCSEEITQFYLPPTHEPYLPLLSSRKASPPFGWYSLRLPTKFLHAVINRIQSWRTWRPQLKWDKFWSFFLLQLNGSTCLMSISSFTR